jgi:hypothetical protein
VSELNNSLTTPPSQRTAKLPSVKTSTLHKYQLTSTEYARSLGLLNRVKACQGPPFRKRSAEVKRKASSALAAQRKMNNLGAQSKAYQGGKCERSRRYENCTETRMTTRHDHSALLSRLDIHASAASLKNVLETVDSLVRSQIGSSRPTSRQSKGRSRSSWWSILVGGPGNSRVWPALRGCLDRLLP